MNKQHGVFLNILTILALLLAPFFEITQPVLALGTGCASSSPVSGTYSVTVCFSEPLDGSSLNGNAPVSITLSVTGTNPGTQRLVFYLDGAYLLTDFQSPYTFILPTTKWIDRTYSLSVEAVMRDGFVTQPVNLSVTFNNGIISPPVNQNQFQPSIGATPTNGAPFTVVAGGDGASGEINADKVTDLIKSLNPNLFIYLGDVYNKGTATEFYNWYGTEATRFGQFRSITNPTVGNHEYENGVAPGYFDYWDNVPSYYSYEAGGWHFINLNSNATYEPVDSQSAQYQWLQQDLAMHAGACTVVYYHHPFFNIGPEGSTEKLVDIWSLLAQSDVEIVLTGHDHTYQRWVPLNGNGQPSPTGVTEFVAGASGHGLQTIGGSDSRVAFATDANPTGFGVLVLKLNQNGTNFSYVNTNGSVLDSGVIPCVSANQDSQSPTTPAGLTANAVSATRVDLTWSAASDDTGVNGYTIYRDGAVLTIVPGASLSYSDASALPNATHQYSVDAFDLAGNHSVETASVAVTMPGMPASLSFPVSADTYVNAGSPNSNYGSALTFRLDASPDLHGYLRFNVQGLAGTPITQARLLVYANNTSSLGITAQAVADNSWGETTMNYTNAPALGGVLASSGPITAGGWVTLDVTSAINGEGIFSFGITTSSASALSFPTRESGANAPQLILDLQNNDPDTQAPTNPTGLAGTASGPSEIDLSWAGSTDNIGVVGYTIYRDNIVLANVPETSTLYRDTTASPLTSYSYTVDAFDQAGNHSGPSDPVIVTTPDLPASLTLTPEADTYVNADLPASNYGTALTLRADSVPDLHSYLRFNVQGLLGRPITGARLLVYANTASSQGINIQTVADNAWGESDMNYTTAPALGAVIGSSGPITAGGWVMFDVASFVMGDGSFSFGISTSSTSAISLASRESGANAPQLIIEIQDSQPPTVPTGLTAIVFGSTQVDLTWTASSDNLGVNGYTIFRNGAVLTTVLESSLSYSDFTVQSGNVYQYAIDAFDLAGNHSAVSAQVPVTTPDTTPPSVPSGLAASASSFTQVDLVWTASSDNLGVSGYTLFRDDVFLTTVLGTSLSYNDTTALPGNNYQYAIDAFDQAGNHSAASAPVSATTPGLPSSLTFTPAADTYVISSSPSLNYGTKTILRADASPTTQSYLRFNVQGLFGVPITKARLLLYSNSNSTQGVVTRAVTDNGWGELTTNYSNAPALGSLLASSGRIVTGSWVTLDVTSYVTGEGAFSFGVTTPSTSTLNISSRESGANAPQLILDLQVNGPDTQPPTVPSAFSVTPVNHLQVNLAWEASTDDLGVTGYTLFRNGIELTTLSGSSLSYSDTTISPATTYSYSMDAFDQAGNRSALTNPILVTTPAVPASMTFTPAADTYVNASKPDSNYGKTTTLRLDASPDLHGYLRFSVQGLGGKIITRARLLFYAGSNSSQGLGLLAVGDNSWGELTMNYNNAPALGSLLASSGPHTNGTWVTLDVTAYLTGEGVYSFGLTTPGSSSISFASRESGANAPQLIVDLQ